MYPHERSLVKQLADKPFALIGVNSDRDLDDLKEVIKEKNLTWRSFQNQKGKDGVISEMWAIQGWPTLFILDHKGVIRFKGHGGDIDSVIEELLGEMGHEVKLVHDYDKKKDEEKPDGDSGKEDKTAAEKDGE